MSFDDGAAIVAGLIGGVIMSMLLYMGIAMMPRQMKMNLFLMLGMMMFRDRSMAYVAGAMMHAAMSIVFGLVHVALYNAFGLESAGRLGNRIRTRPRPLDGLGDGSGNGPDHAPADQEG